ncbi:hypothetical protein BY996DRAFT_6468131 [Phakopsora pachyrhizi]|nr:hypothetical protein BY996DRAFT_6468131 [Phakopsora pachyrhizi]
MSANERQVIPPKQVGKLYNSIPTHMKELDWNIFPVKETRWLEEGHGREIGPSIDWKMEAGCTGLQWPLSGNSQKPEMERYAAICRESPRGLS